MKAWKRYATLILCIFFLTLIYLGFIWMRGFRTGSIHIPICSSKSSYDVSQKLDQKSSIISDKEWKSKRRKSYLSNIDYLSAAAPNKPTNHSVIWKPVYKYNQVYPYRNHPSRHVKFASNCRMSNCFDLKKCKPGEPLKIHIYPEESAIPHISVSSSYQKILNIITNSIYYEPDASKACIYITRYDTLDRDPLSSDYQKNLPIQLPLNNGRNHLVFNLYSGTWPDYDELDFSGFHLGYAMLVKASISHVHNRPGFDISLPLFSKNHPEKGNNLSVMDSSSYSNKVNKNTVSIGEEEDNSMNRRRKNLLVFKGKRYLHGIGSETRNTLYHLHNNEDVLIYTTCKHGKRWKEIQDQRCNYDNQNYEQFDYVELMKNSTFCLVPRGRRLGSFRFLESLSFGCIPVLLSNNWVKPFEEVIDWSEILIEGDERSLLQLPDILRSMGWKKLRAMRSQCLSMYETYFGSVEKIVLTTIKILTERIQSELSLNSFIWNMMKPGFAGFAGALSIDPRFSLDLVDYPGYRQCEGNPSKGFTVIVHINKAYSPSNMHRLLKAISKTKYASKVILLWSLPMNPPPGLSKRVSSSTLVPMKLIIPQSNSINSKLYPYKDVSSDAILNLDPESTLTSEELDFGYLVWISFPHRIVGFTAIDHNYDEYHSRWYYTSKWTNQYSIILLDAAFYHRYYPWYYTHHIASLIALNVNNNNKNRDTDNNIDNRNMCDDICLDFLFNFMVSDLINEGPIKVTQRKKTTDAYSPITWGYRHDFLSPCQQCFNELLNNTFGHLPLIKSQVRFDPLLYKDPVSNLRKKYRKLELVV